MRCDAMLCVSLSGSRYLLVSFHGDTNGLATVPVVAAVRNYATARQPDCRLLFGNLT